MVFLYPIMQQHFYQITRKQCEGYFTKQLTSTLQSLKVMKDKKKTEELLQTDSRTKTQQNNVESLTRSWAGKKKKKHSVLKQVNSE